MIRKFKNNSGTTLAAPITTVQTTATLAVGGGSQLPAIGAGESFTLTLKSAPPNNTIEIVQVTGLTGDNITSMVRGQESTTPAAFLAGDFALQLHTSGIEQATAFLDQHNTFTQPQVVPNATVSGEAANLGQVNSAVAALSTVYAPIAGNSAQAFNVANALTTTEAVNLAQMNTAIAAIPSGTLIGATESIQTGARALNTNYTNTTGKWMRLNVSLSNYYSTIVLTINGVLRYGSSPNTMAQNMSISELIPPSATYKITDTAGNSSTIFSWVESV